MPEWVTTLMPEWILKIDAAASSIAVGFACVALICTAILIFKTRPAPAVKLLGSMMVLAMAFASNNAFVYALAIFVVATLVTELDFLEKLAALLWKNDKYWDYRTGQAPPGRIEARVAEDTVKDLVAEASTPSEAVQANGQTGTHQGPADVEVPANAPADEDAIAPSTPLASENASSIKFNVNFASHELKALIQENVSFEHRVLAALSGPDSPFENAHVTTGFTLTSPHGQLVEIDALVKTREADYLVEIKATTGPVAMLSAGRHLERATVEYRHYLRQGKNPRTVLGMLIVRRRPGAPLPHGPVGFPVIGFDETTGKFDGKPLF